MKGMPEHATQQNLPLKRSVTGLEPLGAVGGEMVVVAATVVLKGDWEEEGEEWGAAELKQASRELPA